MATASVSARAEKQGGGLPVIRDAEIEQLLRDYSTPVLRAAGLGQRNIHVVIINDRSFNAFVVDAKRIFVNAGALMDAQTPNQIIGVLAHETGHISGGHLAKLRAELANAQTAAIITMLLGLGAVAAAATSRNGASEAIRPARSSARKASFSARCSPISASRKSRPTAPA